VSGGDSPKVSMVDCASSDTTGDGGTHTTTCRTGFICITHYTLHIWSPVPVAADRGAGLTQLFLPTQGILECLVLFFPQVSSHGGLLFARTSRSASSQRREILISLVATLYPARSLQFTYTYTIFFSRIYI
jgi:biotin transporter BioY